MYPRYAKLFTALLVSILKLKLKLRLKFNLNRSSNTNIKHTHADENHANGTHKENEAVFTKFNRATYLN
jgi:hypothetical protein